MTYEHIPQELTCLNQWMVTREGSKKPYSPNDLTSDAWGKPESWGTFSQAVGLVRSGIAEHIGLVLRKENGIVAIDLDNKPDNPATDEQLMTHYNVLQAFGASYTERSVSSTEDYPGYHIFVRGNIAASVNRGNVELRCDNFIVVTGDVDGDTPKPILNGAVITARLENLAAFMGVGKQQIALVDDAPRRHATEYIVEKMLDSKGSDYLRQPIGKSETDYTIFAWIWESWTQNRVQALEVFDSFPYAQRKKSDGTALTPYHKNLALEKAIALVESKKAAIDITKFKTPVVRVEKEKPQQIYPLVIPPQSLISEIVQYGLQISHKPSEHTALAGALALLAGICGRSYTTPTNGGTALFLFLIAETGAGKEAAKTLVKRLLNNVQQQGIANAPDMAGFKLISGPGVHSMLTEQNGMSTVLLENEGVNKLALISKKASPLHEELLSTLLGLYSDNQPGGMLQRTGHATKEKKLGTIQFPAVSLLFEGVPEEFDRNLSDEMISGGLLPRFITIERIGGTVRNLNVEHVEPSPWLQQQMLSLVKHSIEMQLTNKYQRVDWDTEGMETMHAFALHADAETSSRSSVVTAQLWNRAYENALRVASLVAVAYDMEHPVITKTVADWAINFVMHSLWSMERRFTTGSVGEGDSVQISKVREILEKYRSSEYEAIKNQYTKPEAHDKGIIAYSYLQNKTQSVPAFKKDRIGATSALKRVLETMVNTGELQKLDVKTQSALNIGVALHYGIMA